jgi:hypothetical protein
LDLIHEPCPGDKFWTNKEFAQVHTSKRNLFPGADDSWLEERIFNTLAVEAVPTSHPLASFLRDEIAALVPRSPATLPPLTPLPVNASSGPTFTCRRGTAGSASEVVLAFTPTGSIERLVFDAGENTEAAQSEWSQLLDLRYITSNGNDTADYKGITCDDSTKCANPVDGAWAPALRGFWSDTDTAGLNDTCHIVLELGFNDTPLNDTLNDTLHTHYGAPATVTAEYEIDPAQKKVSVTLTWRNKTATRLPEALTVFNMPRRAGYSWEIDTLGEWVSPANVTAGGEQYEHAVWSGIRYTADPPGPHAGAPASPGLWISTLDAAMACPVLNKVADAALTRESALQKACFDYTIPSPESPARQQQLTDAMIDGLGINLHNNRFTISGFPQWYPFGVGDRYQEQDEAMKFRFLIEER